MTNPWSCLLDAFAIAIDVDPKIIIHYVNHDGSEIIWPHLKEPLNRRGFHIQEMIDFTITQGYAVTPIDVKPVSVPRLGEMELFLYNETNAKKRVMIYLANTIGVLTGLNEKKNRHAIAWKNNKSIDPSGNGEIINFDVETYWLINKRLPSIK